MIQLANDPNASRTFRAAANEDKAGSTLDAQRRNAHPWPFISRYSDKPVQARHESKPAANDSGS